MSMAIMLKKTGANFFHESLKSFNIMAGIQKVRLNNLNINVKNALIIGIIIAKNSPRTIGSKKKNGDSRGITSFTIRDSEVDTINVDVWGSQYFVLTFYERFLVGDVGK